MKLVKLILLLFFFSCHSDKEKKSLGVPYIFNEGLDSYLQQTFNTSIADIQDSILFVVALESCTPCVDTTLYELNNLNCPECSVIWVGIPKDSIMIEKVESINKKFETFSDSTFQIYNYETNIGNPAILLLKDKKAAKHITLDSEIWKDVKKILKL